MMWLVLFSDEARRDLSRLDASIRTQVVNRITRLSEQFDRITHLPLHNDLKGFFKLRVSDWRVAYTFEPQDKIIRIREIKHRSKIYKRRG
ncbi:hypothetical protein A3A39_00630 [Candidatus Kaiserbacteria bacterium RIFCSPLOWO2_01_FULL_54_13]|uniref:Addiction module toxin RelE n=1 Tax=Candidatus Kaiserbacteria bacterium RIFCSPLOWO2_01_FULL_54_13 TaxID=1798512 RepID=A0A1F6EZT8_9BACT|nr:MAG: hypothetical protein A3A39_00630 [Candidatus Kaiserbacteria bacterium RIFCSPLOWO2_01_FULL_54_13]